MKKNTFALVFVILLSLVSVATSFLWYQDQNYSPDSSVLSESVISEAPSTHQSTESQPNIVLLTPLEGSTIGLPLLVKGKAKAYNDTVVVRLKDDSGQILLEDTIKAEGEDENLYTNFEKEFSYQKPQGSVGVLEIFHISPQGVELDKISRPIYFPNIEDTQILIFFSNNQKGPSNCETVYRVNRRIPKGDDPFQFAINELLKGPTLRERNEGYFSNLPTGVSVQNVEFEGGVVTVNFAEDIFSNITDECRKTAIQSQIVNTLNQFVQVNSVKIAAERSEASVSATPYIQ